MQELGISHPVTVMSSKKPVGHTIDNKYVEGDNRSNRGTEGFGSGSGSSNNATEEGDMPADWTVERFYFIVQFAWKRNTVSERIEAIEKGDESPGPDQVAGNPSAGGGRDPWIKSKTLAF